MSCSDVCVSMDTDGCSEFYREATPRARKDYKCCECYRVIAAGEQYEYVTGKYDGQMYVERTCAECAEIRKAFCCDWYFGGLWEAVREQLFQTWNEMTAIDCLAKLKTQAAIDKVRAEYAEYVEDQG